MGLPEGCCKKTEGFAWTWYWASWLDVGVLVTRKLQRVEDHVSIYNDNVLAVTMLQSVVQVSTFEMVRDAW
jgi:hypothetical protein